MPHAYQDDLLDRHLVAWLGDIDEATLALLRSRVEWVEIGAGDTLMREGEPGDSMFLTVSGRLRAYVREADGRERLVREMGRGQIVGEMALFTHEPRSATVVAVRDTVLVKLGDAAFREVLAASPAVSIAVTRQTVQRLRAGPRQTGWARPSATALVPISAGVDTAALAQRLATALGRRLRVSVVDAARAAAAGTDPRALAAWLDAEEAAHDLVLLVADADDSAWTERCCRRADEILLLADATATPALHPSETRFLMQRGRSEAAEVLVLLHPADRKVPQGTAEWLKRRPLPQHLHLRPALERDIERLARFQARTAVGLVFAGGGARGFAHLGALRALQEHGVPVDFVGGTSMGAVMSALSATDQPAAGVVEIARRFFATNPTGDYNPVPLLSLIRGRRLKRAIDGGVQHVLGDPGHAEDLWLSWFAVASNYSQAREEVIERGPLSPALRASAAIPGALPPVVMNGDLLCDGGTFNNFPVDVMRGRRGVGKVIGVDLAVPNRKRFADAEVPSPWALLVDQLRPRRRRRYRYPSLLSYLMNVTILYSASRQEDARRLADLVLRPPLARVGMLQWNRLDAIVQQGYEYANGVLAKLPPEQLAALRDG